MDKARHAPWGGLYVTDRPYLPPGQLGIHVELWSDRKTPSPLQLPARGDWMWRDLRKKPRLQGHSIPCPPLPNFPLPNVHSISHSP